MSGQTDVDKVKNALDLERIISSQASDWVDEGGAGGRKGRCTHPEHGHTGSGGNAGNLIVTDEGWYCYSHDTGGDVLEWIAVEEGIVSCRDPSLDGDDFVETLRVAADRAGVELNEGASDADDLPEKKRAEIELEGVMDFLHEQLDTVVGDITVRGKIKRERGFSDEDIDNAKIGWVDDQVYAELQHEFGNETLQRTGFQTQDGKQFVSGRIIYPYLSQGRPKYWTGRATEESSFEEAKYRKPKGDCPLEQPVHTIRPPNDTPDGGLWIVEGIQDAISMASAGGVKASTAVATNPSGKQERQLLDAARSASHAVVCFDSDDSGVSKSIDLALTLMNEGIETEIASVPEGDDPNDYFSNDGDFADIEPEPAVRKIISERGDNDETLERIAKTVDTDSTRADRITSAVADMTPIRKRTFRKMIRETTRSEEQSGWKEPVKVLKRGKEDITFVFVYDDGTEIEMDSLGGRRCHSKFKEKYASRFNWVPQFSESEFTEMLNAWLANTQRVKEEPLSPERMAMEVVMEKIQEAEAVPKKEDLSVVGESYITFREGEVMVVRDTLLDWLEDMEVSPQQLSGYLDPIKAGKSARYHVSSGTRKRFWRFDPAAIEEEGYSIPEPTAVPESETDTADGANEGVDEL